ncbi:PQQ-dependent sugar dehydrogenase [Marinimicrobium sp. ABcell2]|uniref:PQQ-dependent sugar dehydrogenase n=1 Tax=Marinimicrobium sp. ABcell2 TaxID=3069751 RepID=UPI0027B60951|nr:PQQ-dependent sugar dehydrogenase [Marinimicrobium sp. ABcell2]MDQ2075847.1 PQQ-dependent sugar dehydrogenase [Marinimicrobium sp. ABcell2]
MSKPWPKLLLCYVIVLFVGTLLGSLIQTQFNLAALQSLGVGISAEVRLRTSLQDLVNFGPTYALILGASFVVSLPAALFLGQWAGRFWRTPLCALAAAFGLWAAIRGLDAVAPMPTLIAATRGTTGTLTLLASAALAGALFGYLTNKLVFDREARHYTPVLALLIACVGFIPDSPAWATGNEPVDYQIEVLAENLEHPWSIAFLPDGRALVTERVGRVRVLNADGSLQREPLPGVPAVFASAQAGLKDILLAPDFEHSQLLYLSYACGTRKANHTCVSRVRLTDNGLEDAEEIFRAHPPKMGNAHYGGRMVWLPDNTLVLTLGDGFDYREQAQYINNHLGSIVRLNPDGSAPEDNPFLELVNARPEIYSYGHRNVQGLVYDAENERLISHEHGPRGGDEINIIEAGKNYGWPVVTHGLDYTGARVTPFTERVGMVSPLLHWTPAVAPSGMTLYDGDLFPQWQNSFLIGGLASRQVHRVTLGDQTAEEHEPLFAELEARIRDVRTGPEGAIYLLTDSEQGKVLRVTPSNP